MWWKEVAEAVVGWVVGWIGSCGGNEMKCGIVSIVRKHLGVAETENFCDEHCGGEDYCGRGHCEGVYGSMYGGGG